MRRTHTGLGQNLNIRAGLPIGRGTYRGKRAVHRGVRRVHRKKRGTNTEKSMLKQRQRLQIRFQEPTSAKAFSSLQKLGVWPGTHYPLEASEPSQACRTSVLALGFRSYERADFCCSVLPAWWSPVTVATGNKYNRLKKIRVKICW